MVFVPERHDLALMKVSRGQDRDIAALEMLHRARPLRLKTLVERYDETRIQYVGSVRMLRANFLALVSTLYGEDKADELERGMLLAAE